MLTSMFSTALPIRELDLSRNLLQDFTDVVAISDALKSLRALKLK